MASSKGRTAVKWLFRFLQFLIGVFGAMAIIGVYFKVQQSYPEWQALFISLGFLGEAAAFILMGALSLIEGFFVDDDLVAEGGASAGRQGAAVGDEVSASFRKMMDERISDELNAVMASLSSDVERFGNEMRQMSAEMGSARSSVKEMHTEMSRLSDEGFASGTQELSEGIQLFGRELRAMGTEMQQSRAATEEARNVLSRVASSDLAADAERFEQGMKLLGDEVHAMSEEMGPARNAVEGMRAELNKVTSGDLAGDAERLGTGMRTLGDEMQGAGSTVEAIRGDLERMSNRFRLFNNPVGHEANGSAASQPSNHKQPVSSSNSR